MEAMQQSQFRQLDYLNQYGREIKEKEAAEIEWEQKQLGRVRILELASLSWGVLGGPGSTRLALPRPTCDSEGG